MATGKSKKRVLSRRNLVPRVGNLLEGVITLCKFLKLRGKMGRKVARCPSARLLPRRTLWRHASLERTRSAKARRKASDTRWGHSKETPCTCGVLGARRNRSGELLAHGNAIDPAKMAAPLTFLAGAARVSRPSRRPTRSSARSRKHAD